MASRTREQRVISAVSCPTCGAHRGQLCRVNPKTLAAARGRPVVHSERRKLWQQQRSPQACSICGHVPAPNSDEIIEPSDIMPGAPLTCWLCDEIYELERELERLRAIRMTRLQQLSQRPQK